MKEMKLRYLMAITFITAVALASLPAKAEEEASKVDQRQANQEKRIENGVASGELTKHEAKHLERGQKRIGAAEERAEADGNVTKGEARHLNRMQNRASRAIHRQKHDRKRR